MYRHVFEDVYRHVSKHVYKRARARVCMHRHVNRHVYVHMHRVHGCVYVYINSVVVLCSVGEYIPPKRGMPTWGLALRLRPHKPPMPSASPTSARLFSFFLCLRSRHSHGVAVVVLRPIRLGSMTPSQFADPLGIRGFTAASATQPVAVVVSGSSPHGPRSAASSVSSVSSVAASSVAAEIPVCKLCSAQHPCRRHQTLLRHIEGLPTLPMSMDVLVKAPPRTSQRAACVFLFFLCSVVDL